MIKYCCRFDIEELFKQAEAAFKTLSIFAPKEKAEELGVHITTLNERLEVLHLSEKLIHQLRRQTEILKRPYMIPWMSNLLWKKA